MPSPTDQLQRLYCDYRQQLFTCALAVTCSPARAEDAVHDAFCQLLAKQAQLTSTPPVDLVSYVFRAVRNAAIDQVRRMKTAPEPLPDFIFDPARQPAAAIEEAEFQRHVVDSLHELTPDERETVVHRVYAGLTFQQIAAIRDTPQGTVASWYRRGLEKLRRHWEAPHGIH